MKSNWTVALLVLSLIGSGSGCAALSLFGQTHTHTHKYECDKSHKRIGELERRIEDLESRLTSRGPALPGPLGSTSDFSVR